MVHLRLPNKGDTSLLGPLSSSLSALFVVPGSNMSSSGPSALHKWGPSTFNQGWITARLHVWLFIGGHFRTQLSLMQSVKKKWVNLVVFGRDEVWMWDLCVKMDPDLVFISHLLMSKHTDTLLSPFPLRMMIDCYLVGGTRALFHMIWAGLCPHLLLMLDSGFPELSLPFRDTLIYGDLIQLRGNRERTLGKNGW